MGQIISVELKKAFLSRKNWILTGIYIFVLLAFAAVNMNRFEQVRIEEAQRLFYHANWIHRFAVSYRENRDAGFDLGWELQTIANDISYHVYSDKTELVFALSEAVFDNDRSLEVELYAHYWYTMSNFWPIAFTEFNFPRFPPYQSHYAPELAEHARVNYEFMRLIVDNDIHFVYESEMKGFNFLYQAMRTILPLALLFFAFLTICDVFAFDNEAGSYKLLLTQPFPRRRIYLGKIIASFTVLTVQLVVVLLVSFLIVGGINGFGSPNYPVLMQTGSHASFTPVPNYSDYISSIEPISYHEGFAYRIYVHHEFYMSTMQRLGLSYFYVAVPSFNDIFIPHESLNLYWKLTVILSTLPMYLLLLLLVSVISALIAVLSQSGIVTAVAGAVLSVLPLIFALPQTSIPFWQRLNPLLYIHTISVLGGIGGTTALAGLLTLTVLSIILLLIGVLIFKKKDIRCYRGVIYL